ncbi:MULTISPECIES: ABC transporter permease [unclassified Niallia]|uniref:ABC transporter permease n=1 Tax=Niallia TaxID=2837506 RepID=UPI001EDC7F02|nr:MULTISPECIES: ABC transporter permease [unclassified Niallia]MDL0434924.1 ABC transporter permease [Niallia sp. SS-2023]UPO88736.1 ABC transporter permease [Niallia sp. Man26]
MNKFLLTFWRPLLVLLLLFGLWEAAVRFFHIENWLLPSPSAILTEANASWDTFFVHLIATTKLSVIGFLIGSAVGLLIAVTLHRVAFFREAVYPLLILSQNIPTIVLAPLLVVWFGFGIMPKLIVITLVCFFPITVACLDGFRQTSPELKHFMQMSGSTKRQMFWKLEWPYALPSIFSGLKISATYSVMGAVISEWLGSKEGIGVYMTMASKSFRTDRVFVAIFAIMALSLLFFVVIKLLEKWCIRGQSKEEK